MSYSAVATYTTGKSADVFGQGGYEELGNDFFDQFITYSPLDETSPEYNLTDNFLERSISDAGDLSLGSTDDEAKHASLWCGDGWAESSASLPIAGSHFYSEITGRAAISDSELLSLENINLESPQIPAPAHQSSLPPSPSPNATLATRRKSRIVESLSKTLKKATASFDKRSLRSPIRKLSASPTMIRGHSNKSSLDLHLENFDFGLEANILPLSPPPSAKAPNAFQKADMPSKGKLLRGFSYNRNASGQRANPLHIYDTPLSTPILEPSSRVVSQSISAETGLYPITPQTQNSAPQWTQLPNSPEFANSVYPDLESPLWYGNANTTTLAQPSPSGLGFHTNPAQRATKSLAMQLQNDLAFSTNDLQLDPVMPQGLGIQMPIAQQFIMGSPPIMQRGFYASPNERQTQPHPHQLQQRASQQNIRQQQQRQQHSRQVSGGFSNGNGNGGHFDARPRIGQHQGSYGQRQGHGQSHSPIRRPNPRPRSRSPNSSSSSPPTPFTVRKRRSNGNTKKVAKEKAVVGFVNYTPSDSDKILTGVAPSGSSKTKARREKEALDKRRRLSQAAVRAVRAAGGSLEGLGEFGDLI